MEKEIIIDSISDTHTQHNGLAMPGGDILLCSGDVSYRGTLKENLEFLTWFSKQNYRHLIMTPGNHDFGFEKEFEVYANLCKTLNITILNDSGTEVEGIKIHGSPVQPWFHDWAFNRQRGAEIKKHWDLIPNDTEVLITHGPPYGVLDATAHGENVGCEELLYKLAKTQIKLHVFGHIHEGHGHMTQNGTLFVNASVLDERYRMISGKPTRVIKSIDGTYSIR